MPTSPPAPTAPPVSAAYQNPQAAIRQALRELGQSDAVNNPNTQFFLDRAAWIRGMYNIATADTGHFNSDTTNFYPWLKQYIASWSSTSPEATAFLKSTKAHVEEQIQVWMQNPSNDLGQRLLLIEYGRDPVFQGQGPGVYWDYLLGGYAMSLNSISLKSFMSGFQNTVLDYQTSPATASFGPFLAQSRYLTGWLHQ